MTEAQMREIARGNIERHLGADWDPEEEVTPDMIYDDAFVLGSDALRDAGVPAGEANRVAQQVAMEFAQP
jgi:hypothetical protein